MRPGPSTRTTEGATGTLATLTGAPRTIGGAATRGALLDREDDEEEERGILPSVKNVGSTLSPALPSRLAPRCLRA